MALIRHTRKKSKETENYRKRTTDSYQTLLPFFFPHGLPLDRWLLRTVRSCRTSRHAAGESSRSTTPKRTKKKKTFELVQEIQGMWPVEAHGVHIEEELRATWRLAEARTEKPELSWRILETPGAGRGCLTIRNEASNHMLAVCRFRSCFPAPDGAQPSF